MDIQGQECIVEAATCMVRQVHEPITTLLTGAFHVLDLMFFSPLTALKQRGGLEYFYLCLDTDRAQ